MNANTIDHEAHYYYTLNAFAELAENGGLEYVLTDLCKVLNFAKALPYELHELKHVYNVLQYMQDATVNAMLDTAQGIERDYE